MSNECPCRHVEERRQKLTFLYVLLMSITMGHGLLLPFKGGILRLRGWLRQAYCYSSFYIREMRKECHGRQVGECGPKLTYGYVLQMPITIAHAIPRSKQVTLGQQTKVEKKIHPGKVLKLKFTVFKAKQ